MESNDKQVRPPLELVANHLFPQQRPASALVVAVVSPAGYDALRTFFQALPNSCRISFILLSTSGSAQRVVDLLQEAPQLKTTLLRGREKMAPGTILVVPTGKHIAVRDGVVQVVAPATPDASQLPIDAIFRSLAILDNTHTITLLFTDAFGDGLAGLKQLRSVGGLLLQAAPAPLDNDQGLALQVRTLADAVLPPPQLATLLTGYLKSRTSTDASRPMLWRDEKDLALLEDLFQMLEKTHGVNFGVYQPDFLERAISERMRLHQTTSVSHYAGLVKSSSTESSFLAKRLLFRHASFYKPGRLFQKIKETFVHRILELGGSQGVCRIWVPECASGEEALMLALLLHERTVRLQSPVKIQIVATDSDTETLAFARKGIYGLGIATQLPAMYLDRYFRREGDQYQAGEELHKLIHFFSHNTLHTPPLNGLHAIYGSQFLSRLNEGIQREVIAQFLEALAPGGFLILDPDTELPAETPGFSTVGGAPSIFQKRALQSLFAPAASRPEPTPIVPPHASSDAIPETTLVPKPEASTEPLSEPVPVLQTDVTTESSEEDQADDVVEIELTEAEVISLDVDLDASKTVAQQPTLLVDAEGRIIEQAGPVGAYLELPGDSLRVDLIDLVIPDIRADLKAALEQAIQRNKTFKSKEIPFEINGQIRPVQLQIRPVTLDDGATAGAEVTFFDAANGINDLPESEIDMSVTRALETMEHDLAQLKTRLHTMLDDVQTSRETLRTEKTALEAQAEELRRQMDDLNRRNADLTDTNKELLALNRDLVKKVEEMRRNLQQAARKPEPAPAPAAEPEPILKTPLGGLLSKRHEIRTALTSIIGFADLLADRLRDENKELAKYVGTGGKQLSEALSVLLNQDDEAPAPPPAKVREVQVNPTQSTRVLVVDDSDETRRLLALVLSDRFECEMAASAAEAIEKARQEYFTAVLLDINLGKDASGLDVLRDLRGLTHYQHVPFMAVTALATPRDRALLLQEGFDAYLPKPFHKTALLNTLEQAMTQKSMN